MALPAAEGPAQPPAPLVRRVLIIDQEAATRPAFVRFMDSFRRTLAGEATAGFEVFVENLDLQRLGRGQSDLQRAAGWLLEKYSDAAFDVIVPTSRITCEFALASREELAPQATIVSVNRPGEGLAASSPLPPAYTYVDPQPVVAATIALACDLFPATRQLAFVGQTRPHPQFLAAQLEEARIAAEDRGLGFVSLVDLSLADTRSRLQTLPADSIVLYIGFWKDEPGGMTYVPATILETFCKDSKAPIFGVIDTYVGRGIVGGACIDTADLGAAAARLVAASQAGLPLPPRRVTTIPMLDQRALDRFGVPPSRVPSPSVVRFREPGFWDRYWPQALVAGCLLVLQAGLIIALVEQLRRRRKAERLVDEQRTLIAHAGRISTLGQFAASLAHELGQPLGAMLNNIEAAEQLLRNDDSPYAPELRQILADLAADDHRAGEVLTHLRDMVRRQLPRRGPVAVADLVRGTLALAGPRLAAAGISVVTDCSPTLPRVAGDQILLQQALLNLIGNAIDAIEQKNRLEAGRARPGSPLQPGKITLRASLEREAIALAVIDNGGGLEAEEVDRARTTFWTTKPNGLGMGLPIVQSIMEQHEGTLTIENDPPHGLTVCLSVPVWKEGVADDRDSSPD